MLKKYILLHKKFFILFIFLILTSSITGALIGRSLKRHDESVFVPPVKIKTFTVGGANKENQQSTYSGEIRSRYESNLSFQAGGKIIARNIQSGSVVHKGDVLFQLDTRDLRQNVKNYQAQESSSRAQLELAANNLHRYQKLFQEGAVSKAEYEQYAEQYKNALAAVSQSEAQYTQSSNQLDYSDLTAPFDGIITSINAESGQVVSAGQIIAAIAQPNVPEIEFYVPENKIADLSIGENVSAGFWAFPDLRLNAAVKEISPFADSITHTFKVRASLLRAPASVKLGMTASISVPTLAHDSIVRIPLAAVYQSENEGSGVWLVHNNKLAFTPVVLGKPVDNKNVNVLSGLSQGDCIAAAGVNELYEGEFIEKGDAVS